MKKSTKFVIIELILLLIVINSNSEFIIGIICILIHEVTHIIIGNMYGCKLYNLNIGITGTSAELSDVNELKDSQKIILYFSGPFANLLLAFIFFSLSGILNCTIITLIYSINVGLFIFNIIPAYPLDGARILEIILNKKLTYRRGKKIIEIISFFISGFFVCIFIVMLILHRINISLLLVGALIMYTTILENKSTMYIMMSDLIKKRKILEKYEYIDNRSISVYYKSSLLNVLRLVDKSKFNVFYILDEELKLLKIIHEDELLDILKEKGNITLEEYITSTQK